MAAILVCFKIVNRDSYCPMKGYIHAKNEVKLPNSLEIFNAFICVAEGVNVPVWWPFWIFSKILIRIFIAL